MWDISRLCIVDPAGFLIIFMMCIFACKIVYSYKCKAMKHDTIYGRFKEIASRYPSYDAIIEEHRTLTYAQLDAMADGILGKIGNVRHPYIGIVMSHGAEMIAAILAVLKSGAAYIPAEPSLPKDRIDYMMSAAGVGLVLTDELCRDLPTGIRGARGNSSPDMPAYVLYTSGTTGRPKGVVVENRSVVNYAEAFEAEFHVAPGDVMLQYSVCSFDIFVEEVFTTLLNGGTLAIPPQPIPMSDIDLLMDFVARHKVSIISGFPYLLAEMNRLDSIPSSLRLLISGGDVLRDSYISRLRDMGVEIYNTYGPSETTVCASYFRCDNARPLADGTLPIGKEVKGVKIKILDDDMREVADGGIGEICIYGKGVSRGYLGNPPEQANFVLLPDGHRMYRSGDLGYRLPDGNIAFLHRKDEQVMILGKRVEPDEVENVLNTAPDVERGVVCPYSDDSGLSYLVAYFVPKEKKFSLSSIKTWLSSKLSDFMVPEYFVAMKSIPLTVRGKVDRASLPVVLKEGGLYGN